MARIIASYCAKEVAASEKGQMHEEVVKLAIMGDDEMTQLRRKYAQLSASHKHLRKDYQKLIG